MTELENQVEETLEEEQQEEETTPETQEDDNTDEISYEQALEWKKKAERLDKAEKKLVELKKANKPIKKETNSNSLSQEELVEKILAEREFFKENPDAKAYMDKIKELQSKGLSLDVAYYVASMNDKKIEENREIYGSGVVKGSTNVEGITTVTSDAFDKMTTKQQEDYTNKMIKKFGKVKFKY